MLDFEVIKEVRATFSAGPGLLQQRPKSITSFRNLFLAGDWTNTGWPSTMEGAAKSGYAAAEALTEFKGEKHVFQLS
jgi:hydroxysqualene dehydroxylase